MRKRSSSIHLLKRFAWNAPRVTIVGKQAKFSFSTAVDEQLALPTSQLPAVAAPSLSAVLVTIKPVLTCSNSSSHRKLARCLCLNTTAGQEDLLVQGIVDKARKQLFMFRVLLTIIAAIIMALIIYTLTLDKIYAIALLKLIECA